VTIVVTAPTAGTIPNKASAWADNPDPNESNNVATAQITVGEQPPPPPPPPPTTSKRTITLTLSGKLDASGKVKASDGFEGCISGVTVKLQRKQGKSWKGVGETTTKPDGSYSSSLPDKPGRYRAVAPKTTSSTHICAAAVSLSKTH
jgi:hypothetical protein